MYRTYKKRNIQASLSAIASWAASNPSLFVGVSLDSETIMPGNKADYNPLAIEEWRQWYVMQSAVSCEYLRESENLSILVLYLF